ncbi:MAG: hypothetical protein RI947_874 [Candidatus Parcubacteria bacterium]|jgi:alpha-beta hydrolase superfamily lysophospholipase
MKSSTSVKLTTYDGFELDARYTHIENARKAVILAHGMTSSMEKEVITGEVEKRLNEAGISTLRFDFRAHGNSKGDSVKDFTISGEMIDLETMVGFIKEKDYTWVGLVGCSFGGGIASLYAGANADVIQALCLVNPVLDYAETFLNPTTEWTKKYMTDAEKRIAKDGFIELGSAHYRIGPALIDEIKEYSPYELLEKYYGNLLIVQGDQDEILNHQELYTQFINLESDTKRMEIIKGARHGFHEAPYTQEVAEMIADFFAS